MTSKSVAHVYNRRCSAGLAMVFTEGLVVERGHIHSRPKCCSVQFQYSAETVKERGGITVRDCEIARLSTQSEEYCATIIGAVVSSNLYIVILVSI